MDDARWLRCDGGVAIRVSSGAVLSLPRRITGAGPQIVAVVPHPAGVELVAASDAAGRRVIRSGEPVELVGHRFELIGGPSPLAAVEVRLGSVCTSIADGSVGGSPADDLRHPELPPGALVISDGAVVLGADAQVGSSAARAGERRPIDAPVTFSFGAVTVELRPWVQELGAPHRLDLRSHGQGASLLVWRGDRVVTVALTALRARLARVLLEAWPDGVGDEALIARVWPRNRDRSRLDVNQLVHRIRVDLAHAGVDSRVIVRSPSGGYTALSLPPGATVTVG